MAKKKNLLKSVSDEPVTNELEENVLPPENIVVLNELRSASDLNRLMTTDDSIDLKPDFQRNEVWTPEARARFIDSLSKEFPIPSMCFAHDPKEQKYIVIDGLQRMSTIKKFLGDESWILPKLKDIDTKIAGKSVSEIKRKNPEIFRKIENVSLPVTILRYDPNRKDNMEYIFTIFQRLNTFGERLNIQEIRNAIFQGPFNMFLKECGKNQLWRKIALSQKRKSENRMVAEERALRFFAFLEDSEKYTGKLNKFLNEYMQKNRHLGELSGLQEIFGSVVNILDRLGVEKIGKSIAFTDALFHGIAKNIFNLENLNKKPLEILLNKLKEDEHFTPAALSEGTMQTSKVQSRLLAAEKIFAEKI